MSTKKKSPKSAGNRAIKAKSSKKAADSTAATKPKPFGVGQRGARYTNDQKAQVVDFVNEYNAKHGRGGQSRAAKQFSLSVLTVASWLRSPHITSASSVGGKEVLPAGLKGKLNSLVQIGDELRKAETEVTRLRAKYDAVRSSIQSMI